MTKRGNRKRSDRENGNEQENTKNCNLIVQAINCTDNFIIDKSA